MRCFMTGGTGYIGRHLARRLVRDGHQVRAAVRSRQRATPDPVEELRATGVELANGDLLDPSFLAQALDGCDVVFHLAWQTNRPSLPGVRGGDYSERRRANVEGARLLIELCKSGGVERFVFTSTIAVYGNTSGGGAPIRVEDAGHFEGVTGEYREYGEMKLEAERMIADLMPPPSYVILRPSIVYGDGAPFAVNLLRSALFGPQTRQFSQPVQWVHVEDVVNAGIAAATTERGRNMTFNIAGDETVSSDSLHDAIRLIAGVQHHAGDYGSGDGPLVLLPPKYDVTAMRDELGFRPAISLSHGLPQMVSTALQKATASGPLMQPANPWPRGGMQRPGWGAGGGFPPPGWWRR